MRVIYTSKGMSKSLGCALYIRCALSIEKYGNYLLVPNELAELPASNFRVKIQNSLLIKQKVCMSSPPF
jgi:hypothetical protein